MTVDAVRAGYRLREYELDLAPPRDRPHARRLRSTAPASCATSPASTSRAAIGCRDDPRDRPGDDRDHLPRLRRRGADRRPRLLGVRAALPAAGLGRARRGGDLGGDAAGRRARRSPTPASRAPSWRRSGSPTSARPSSPGTRRAASRSTGRWSGRTGAPRRAASELREAGHEELVRERTGLVLDPYFSGTKIEWLLRNAEGAERRGLRHDRLLAALQAHRPPRHRLHERLADDALRHPPARLGRGALRAARGRPGAPARAAALRRRLRHDDRVRRRGPGRRDRRRPAGGPLRPGLPRAGRRRTPTAPAASSCSTPGPRRPAPATAC